MDLRTPDDATSRTEAQRFTTPRSVPEALSAARVYLEGAGTVAPGLKGNLEQHDSGLVVHHGRVTTRISAQPDAGGSSVHVRRFGHAPLEDTRLWLYGLGLAGFLLAWGLSWYNSGSEPFLPPLVTMTLFFLGIFVVIVVLYVVDHGLERRSESLLASLEDAMRGDPHLVLHREIDGLERSGALANGLLFYLASILAEVLVFVILLSEGVRDGINEAVTLDVMKAMALIPIVPALAFAGIWFLVANRLHKERLALVERRFQDLGNDHEVGVSAAP